LEIDMNGIEELVRDATLRLDHALAHTTAPRLRTPQHSGGRLAARIVVVAVLAAAGYAISVRVADRDSAVTLPPGLLEGRYGTQIELTEVADGDNDPETFALQAAPGGGTVKVTKSSGVAPTTVASTAVDSSHAGSPTDICIETSGAGTGCGVRDLLDTLGILLGSRGGTGQVVVSGFPTSTVAVTFAAGPARYWSEPVHGFVAFPFPVTATPEVTVEAMDRNGRVVWQDTAVDTMLTPSEVVSATVTTQTDEPLTDGWFGDPGTPGRGPEVVRRHGRTALTGFGGPFAAQSYVIDSQLPGMRGWVWAITVRTVDVATVRQRLDPLAGGRVRTTLEPSADARVLIWAGDDVPETEVTRYAGTLTQRAPLADFGTDLDVATAWSSDHTPVSSIDGSPLNALVTDIVGRVDGHDLIAHADDVGEVMFHVKDFDGGYASAGRPTSGVRIPPVGGSVSNGLWSVPSDITAITLTFDDGTTLTPEIIDVRPLVDAKLLFFASADVNRIITAVEATRG
jgi:hypothetical protein